MGLLSAALTQQQLIGYKHDLEEKIETISMAKLSLVRTANDLLTAGNDMDPESPVVKQLAKRRERLNLLEKKLDMQLNELRNQLSLAENSLRLADQQVKSAIQKS